MQDKSIDIQFLNRIALRLERFHKHSDNLWFTRCPICGDSKKSKKKTRGVFGFDKGVLFYYCHNCLVSWPFVHFLRVMDPNLHRQYKLARFKSTKEEAPDEIPDAILHHKTTFTQTTIPPFCVMANFHPESRRYLELRKIPGRFVESLIFTENFKAVVEALDSSKSSGLRAEPRIIIPFYDAQGGLIGIQGRAIDNNPLRYITINLSEEKLIYRFNEIDWAKPIYAFEGPFDSMFVDNAIAAVGSSINTIEVDSNTDLICVFDNQPREKQIVRIVEKTITSGKKVVIWPKSFGFKDVNEAIISGMTQAEVMEVINTSTYSGLSAKLKFSQWKKI